jgi:hypothetical protein
MLCAIIYNPPSIPSDRPLRRVQSPEYGGVKRNGPSLGVGQSKCEGEGEGECGYKCKCQCKCKQPAGKQLQGPINGRLRRNGTVVS